MTGWTNVPKPTNPTVNIFTGGTPIGLLLALTYTTVTSSVASAWTPINKPTVYGWTSVPKPTP